MSASSFKWPEMDCKGRKLLICGQFERVLASANGLHSRIRVELKKGDAPMDKEEKAELKRDIATIHETLRSVQQLLDSE